MDYLERTSQATGAVAYSTASPMVLPSSIGTGSPERRVPFTPFIMRNVGAYASNYPFNLGCRALVEIAKVQHRRAARPDLIDIAGGQYGFQPEARLRRVQLS